MSKSYRQFLKQHIDLSPLGMAQRDENTPYFCTPKGAAFLGWAGVDGIHFVLIRGFGETVFAVSPMNAQGEYVHPIAENFTDFLRLLLSCGDTAALEQAWQWDQAQFDAFLAENPPTQQQRSVLAALREKTGLTPMENPWQYIKRLQGSFDAGRIRYSEDFYDPDMNPAAEPGPWLVYFDGNFWGHSGKGRPGQAIPLGKSFVWAERNWLIPAVYRCGKGLVVDFCIRVEPGQIRHFMDKWDLSPENESQKCFTREEEAALRRENPLTLDFAAQLTVNGRALPSSRGCGVTHNPFFPESIEAREAVTHYSLDPSYGWIIRRMAFPWQTKRAPEIKTLSLSLHARPVTVPGPHFHAAPGTTVEFTHPGTGTAHTLRIEAFRPETIPAHINPRMEIPTHCWMLQYSVTPALPENALSVRDSVPNDPPRPRDASNDPSAPQGAACIGIIGGADGPTAIVFGANAPHAAYSSLHFAPVNDVDWFLAFHVTPWPGQTVELL